MSKTRRHGVFNRSEPTPRIMATERPTVYCMNCMLLLFYTQKYNNREWVLQHPEVSKCENAGKYYEIPSFPLEEVTE